MGRQRSKKFESEGGDALLSFLCYSVSINVEGFINTHEYKKFVRGKSLPYDYGIFHSVALSG